MPAAPPEIRADFSALSAEQHVALAVSGGSDSTALMHLVVAWARTNHPGLRLSVLTVDHSLRAGSAGEALQVKAWAERLGLVHGTLLWDVTPKPATGLQARARGARYNLMAAWCRAHGAGALLTAHTLDDQAETVLMRLARTASPDSLAGIRPRGAWNGLPLLRPLLHARREALRQYLLTLGQDWVEDPSNADPRFERVRVRQSLALSGAGVVTRERLAALADASARTSALLERLTRRWIGLWLREEAAGICHVPRSAFEGLPAALQERILARIITHYGGGGLLPEPQELRRLVHWAASDEGPMRRTLAGALIGRRKSGFWVTREASRVDAAPLTVPGTGKALWDGRFLVDAAPGATVAPAGVRQPGLGPEVPVYAKRAYPWVESPAGAAKPVQIRFLRLAKA
ncbi:tRNA lysidine(34) synthetase TilS [Aestuariivirga sp.]|uniref:tRNA lysidine(34) synthetase TilS n=1 Tax=Aestuariivirga sp. TaxID=2650926 RepID=UPI003BAA61FA